MRVGIAMVLSLAGLLGCGRPASVVPADVPVDWQPFQWVRVSIGRERIERAAILVDPTDPSLRALDGRGIDAVQPARLQLDFGFAGLGRFGIPFRRLEAGSVEPARNSGVLAVTLPSLGPREDSVGRSRGHRLGTLSFLYYGINGLLLDQVERRIGAPRKGTTLPGALLDRMTWTEAWETSGRLALPLGSATDRLGQVWYDAGSSLVPLLVTADVWKMLTGQTGAERSNQRLVFPVGRDSLVLIGARAARSVRLGAIDLGRIVIFHVASAPVDGRPDRFTDGVVGIVGNQLFDRYRLVYIQPRSRRLGVLR